MSVLTPTNISFILQGLWLTIYISFIAIVLSTLIGTVLAVMRNGKNPILRWISSIYIEFVRKRSKLALDFHYFPYFSNEINTSRNYCLYCLYFCCSC